MSGDTIGKLCGLAVAFAWAGSSLAFARAGRRVGSVPVNVLRLSLAVVLLSALSALDPLHRGRLLPTDATPFQARWLALSGVVGFFVGDLALFRAYVLIGARRSGLIMSLAPAFAAAGAAVALGERLTFQQTIGAAVTLAGVIAVVAERAPAGDAIPRRTLALGVALALVGAIGQAGGAVLVKHAYTHGEYDPLGTTLLRALAALPLFVLFVVATRRTRETLGALRDGAAMWPIVVGAIVGPVAGVSLFNASVAKLNNVALPSILSALAPVVLLGYERATGTHVSWRAALGALVAVAGVAILVAGGSK